MARYTGPTTKIARKFGEPIFGADKDFEKIEMRFFSLEIIIKMIMNFLKEVE